MMQLKIYSVALEMVGQIAVVARRVERADRDLARQMRRASTSVPLNISEGVHSRGGNQAARFHNAMASARETAAALDVSVAACYISADGLDEVLDRLDHIVATLWKLIHRR
jgi:four helix bundle protein